MLWPATSKPDRLGSKGSRKLRLRMFDLTTAGRVSDLVMGRPHPLKYDQAGKFAVDIDGGRRLVFVPAHYPVPLSDDSSVAWAEVTAVRIVYIGDYHD
jgi:proteic killer suppression protein